jgi:ADP-ribose pyrophosphatase
MHKLFKGKIFDIVGMSSHKNGEKAPFFECVRHAAAVAVVAVAKDGRFLLVSQYRPCIGRTLWEVPAGLVEKNESPQTACRRELKEETGYSAGKIRRLCDVFSSPGFTDEKILIFTASGLKPGKASPDPGEKIRMRFFTRQEIGRLIGNGKIMDAKTIIALMMMLHHRP